MMGAICALLALAFVLHSPAAAQVTGPDFPSQTDVEQIMVEFVRCEGESCPAPPSGAIVRNLRCMPDRDWEYEGRTRVICVFSGRWIGPGLEDAVMDCAYLWRSGERDAWTFQASPDGTFAKTLKILCPAHMRSTDGQFGEADCW